MMGRASPASRVVDTAALWAVALGLFLPAMARGEIPFFMDILAQFYPLRAHAAHTIAGGEWPLWTRTMFCGVPFLANPQWGLLYPLNWPFLVWPDPWLFTFSYPLHFAIGAAGVYAATRQAGGGRLGGLAGGLAFLLNSMTLGRVAFGAHHLALAWLPWGWVCLGEMRGRGGNSNSDLGFEAHGEGLRRWAAATAGLALVTALQLTSGAPQIAAYATGSYVLLALMPCGFGSSRKEASTVGALPWRLGGLIAGCGIGALLASPQTLTTWNFLKECERSGALRLEEVAQGTLGGKGLLAAFLGGSGLPEDAESTAFFGLDWVLFAILGAALGGRKAAPFATLLLVCLLYGWQPLAPLLYAWLPGYSLFHDPKRMLVVAATATAVLGGIGVAEAFGGARGRSGSDSRMELQRSRGIRGICACVVWVALAGVALRVLEWPAGPTWDQEHPALGWFVWPWNESGMRIALGLCGTVGVGPLCAMFAMTAPRLRRAWGSIAVAAACGAMALFSVARVDLKMAPATRFFDPDIAASLPYDGRFLAFDTWGRATSFGSTYSYDYPAMETRLFPNAGAFYGLQDAQGYDAFQLRGYAREIREASAGGILLYESHFGLITRPASGEVARLGVKWATGPADALFQLPNPQGASANGAASPIVRPSPLDEAATATLSFEAFFPATPGRDELDGDSATIQFGGEDRTAARPLLAAGFKGTIARREARGKQPAGWRVHGRWEGAIPPGAGGPRISLREEGAEFRWRSYLERTPKSMAPFDLAATRRVGGETWLRYAEAEPLLSVTGKEDVEGEAGGDSSSMGLAFKEEGRNAGGCVFTSEISSNAIEADVEAPPGGGRLLVRDAWAPGWKATVDGEPAAVQRAEGMFRAVPLKEGQRKVSMRYEPPGLRAGAVCAAVGCIGLLGLGLTAARGRRRGEAPRRAG